MDGRADEKALESSSEKRAPQGAYGKIGLHSEEAF
jgi:hypothetical protein